MALALSCFFSFYGFFCLVSFSFPAIWLLSIWTSAYLPVLDFTRKKDKNEGIQARGIFSFLACHQYGWNPTTPRPTNTTPARPFFHPAGLLVHNFRSQRDGLNPNRGLDIAAPMMVVGLLSACSFVLFLYPPHTRVFLFPLQIPMDAYHENRRVEMR